MTTRTDKTTVRAARNTPPGPWASRLPGLALVAVLTVPAMLLGRLFPLAGGPVIGIVLGMLVQAVRPPSAGFRPGIAFAGKYVLQASVVVLGLTLSLAQLWHTGRASFPVMMGTLVIALVAAALLGRAMRVPGELRTLIGTGTAICGGSAIAATSAAIGASEISIAYALSTVFAYNAVAVLAFPALGHLMHLSQDAFGLWAGTAINDTSSVVAAGYVFGSAAGAYAVVVKLTRTTMIIPITLVLALGRARRLRRGADGGPVAVVPRADGRVAKAPAGVVPAGVVPAVESPVAGGAGSGAEVVAGTPWRRIIPWFVVWFALAAVINSLGLVPGAVAPDIEPAAKVLITAALTAVGLSARFRDMRAAGAGPFVFGGILWVIVAGSSVLLQLAFGLL